MKSKTIRILVLGCAGILALKFGTATLLKALSYNIMGKNMSAPLSLAPEASAPEVVPPATEVQSDQAPLVAARWITVPGAHASPSGKGQSAYSGSRRNTDVFPEGEQIFQPSEVSSFAQFSSGRVRVRNEALPPILSPGSGKSGQPSENETKPVEEEPGVEVPPTSDPVPPVTDPVPPVTDPVDTQPEDDGSDQLPPHELPGLPGDEDNDLPKDTPKNPPYNGGDKNPPTNSVPDGGLTSVLLALGVASLAIAKHRSRAK